MKACNVFNSICLAIIAVFAWQSLDDRWDSTEYYVPSNKPFPLVDVDRKTDQDSPHQGAYHAGDKLTYKIDRTSKITVTAKTTRRIVRKFQYNGGVAREPIFSYLAQPAVRIDEGRAVSFPTIELPKSDILTPGVYSIETSVEFPVHGELKTYVAETSEVRVE